jgi:hypothetical protein
VHMYVNSVVICAHDISFCFGLSCASAAVLLMAGALPLRFMPFPVLDGMICFWLLTGDELWSAHVPTRMYMQALRCQE